MLKKHADLVLIASLLLISLVALGLWNLTRVPGDAAVVTLDGKEIGRYPLSRDAEVRIESDGGNYNVLVIRDGCASVREASCPDGICAEHAPISRDGETILCLPHRVAIHVEGAAENEIDGVA